MPDQKRIVRKSHRRCRVLANDGTMLCIPDGWSLLPPGDATLTRRTKSAGPHWQVESKRGRRTYSGGVWAPTKTIDRIRADLEAERSTEQYARKQQQARDRRVKKQSEYVDEFKQAVLDFLNFDDQHAELAEQMASAMSRQATPVGSGTVARTKRIPVQRRAGSAVIAWLRHHTTEYDSMKIERVRGRRREVRRRLAARSKQLLQVYRDGISVPEKHCKLRAALAELKKQQEHHLEQPTQTASERPARPPCALGAEGTQRWPRRKRVKKKNPKRKPLSRKKAAGE